ncbi:hypothetical protein QYE76_066910 [Lolium multiflorum]|uniref:RNase H type-1 domain-containing protein n=1 Tax=Lolium multiflorum TaxID=4521 RepID=A0AAD8SBV2_LOLMU|nr:hypothetical protein QYE76_066910 [Lolium multiflorum]
MCKQGPDETDRAYLRRLCEMRNFCEGVHEIQAVSFFMAGCRPNNMLWHKLRRSEPKAMAALMAIADKYALAEEAGKSPAEASPAAPKRDHHKPTEHKSAEGASHGSRRDNYRGKRHIDQPDRRYCSAHVAAVTDHAAVGGSRRQKQDRPWKPKYTFEQMFDSPCKYHSGKNPSNHTTRDCHFTKRLYWHRRLRKSPCYCTSQPPIGCEVLSQSKQNYPHYQKLTYGVYMAAKKLKHYFQEHPIKVVCTAPLAEIIGSKDAHGRVANRLLRRMAEMQYLPPVPDSTHWKLHFDGSKMRTGLGAGVVVTSPKGDRLDYVLQIHFAASNNVAEYEALIHGLKLAKEIGVRCILCFGDSDLVVQQASGEWDAKDANMASYRFHVQQLAGFFEGCEFHHVPRANNKAADALSKIGSTRQAIPPGVALQHLRKPSITLSPDSDSIFVPADPGAPQPNPGASQPKSGAS